MLNLKFICFSVNCNVMKTWMIYTVTWTLGIKFMKLCVLQAEKRAHHNALERKRRDHIKDSFSSLRDSVPALSGEKVVCYSWLSIWYWLVSHKNNQQSRSSLPQASRAQILKKAAEYIQFMRKKNNSHQQDIEDLKRQNNLLEAQSELYWLIFVHCFTIVDFLVFTIYLGTANFGHFLLYFYR